MSTELHFLEESLKSFLIQEQSDSYNAKSLTFYKYNNLRILMEPNQNKTPHFIVRIGISEAMYGIDSWEKLQGGLGSDERLIRKWFDKNHIKADLVEAWKRANMLKPVTMRQNFDEQE
jgi:hypothetical protein